MKLSDLPDNHDLKHLEGMIGVMRDRGCQFRGCIEIGAHRGIWTNRLSQAFEWVYAFEPEPTLCQRLKRELKHDNVVVHQAAIMDKPGRWTMGSGLHNTGQGWLRQERTNGAVVATTIDRFLGVVPGPVDFIKIDTEGAEVFALWGGRQIIQKYRPWIMIEENGLDEKHYDLPLNAASDHLQSIGMRQYGRWNKDKLFGW